MAAKKNIVVLGGGSGGVAAAVNLGDRLGTAHNVVLVDRQPFHVYQPAFLAVMTGARKLRDITRDLMRLRRHNVRVVLGTVHGIDTADQVVHIDGETLPYDALIVSLGLQTHPEDIPGLREGAHHAWELDAAVRCNDALTQFSGGTLVVGQPTGPYRCPPAPFEALFSIDSFLAKRGIRDKTDIHFVAPTPRPGGDPYSPNRWLTERAEERGVTMHYDFAVAEIDADGRKVRGTTGQSLDYDLMFMIPPHRPAQILLDSGIAEPAGVKVDYDYLTTDFPNVWAIGDCANFPGSKAGVVAHQQADLVAHNIAAMVTGTGHKERFKLHTT